MSDLIDIKSESEKEMWIKRILWGLEIANKVKSESYEERQNYKSKRDCNICIKIKKNRRLKTMNLGKSEGKFIKGV